MKRIKEFVRKYMIGLTFSFIICIVSVSAITYFPSNQTIYNNETTGMSSTNVQDAINELYSICFPKTGGDVIADLLPTHSNELYKDDKENIRYYGKNPNNYVNFNNELWRIIGIIDGKIKLIKAEHLGKYKWASNGKNNWNNSDLKSYLNGEYYNNIDENFRNMIAYENYYLGTPINNRGYLTASDFYEEERSDNVYSENPTNIKQYIGLMYPSDYGYAAGETCRLIALNDFDECVSINYLYITSEYEWLQTPDVNDSMAFTIRNNGSVGVDAFTVELYSWPIRPVLYLTNETIITGGDGSQNNPYTLG